MRQFRRLRRLRSNPFFYSGQRSDRQQCSDCRRSSWLAAATGPTHRRRSTQRAERSLCEHSDQSGARPVRCRQHQLFTGIQPNWLVHYHGCQGLVTGGYPGGTSLCVALSRFAGTQAVFAVVPCTANRSTLKACLYLRILAAVHDQATPESQDRNDDAQARSKDQGRCGSCSRARASKHNQPH